MKKMWKNDVENAWGSHQRTLSTAAASDVFTYGGLLDRVSSAGYETPIFAPGTVQMILEQKFSYDELKFISNARLAQMTIPDIDRLISLLEKLKNEIHKLPLPANDILVSPSHQSPSWGYKPYYHPRQSTIQPLYGCPAPNCEEQAGPNEPDPQYTATLSVDNPDGITIDPNPVSLAEDASAENIFKYAEKLANELAEDNSDESKNNNDEG